MGSGELKSLVKASPNATATAPRTRTGLWNSAWRSPPRRSRACVTTGCRCAETPTTDGLTNLANRKSFDEELERACAEADAGAVAVHLARARHRYSFKNVNDTWGHQTGDQVLRFVAAA